MMANSISSGKVKLLYSAHDNIVLLFPIVPQVRTAFISEAIKIPSCTDHRGNEGFGLLVSG